MSVTGSTATSPRATTRSYEWPSGSGLQASNLSQQVAGRTLLADISLTFPRGELVAIIGGSGAGKTTLLESLAGVRQPHSGSVTLDGVDVTAAAARQRIGCVPQDDIIHLDLPLRRTVAYAARLRLPGAATRTDIETAVDRVLDELDLADRADVPVRELSGGQRKRASIAVELLTRPQVLLLDEPTSGLDPATAAEVMGVLRTVASHGTTVVVTTHAPADVRACDRVVLLARGGRMAFDGSPPDALRWFGVDHLDALHTAVAEHDPQEVADRFAAIERSHAVPPTDLGPTDGPSDPAGMAGAGRQLLTLIRRSAELMLRTRLTSVILIGSPTLVIAMMTTLFRPDTFIGDGDAIGAIQLVYWIAFAGFFFGLTYGLLQIVTEAPVVRRERFWGLSMTAYVTSKILVLLPLLLAVDVALFTVLHATDRLPSADARTWLAVGVVFLLDAAAGLALGLLASALVTTAAQATLALPMLCFPQVLFAGAMVPVGVMTAGGRAISDVMSNRWAFEAIGRILDLGDRVPAEQLGAWEPAFRGDATAQVAALIAMVSICLVVCVLVLSRRLTPR
ncbi:ATP-binding cassette domain-containing protein [Nitriliruptor alkaliphilus]|uniref:ATP-binding cassette domain-containing protein n=1 Tax=Nitriliruptor alkaliphilus TaxID=427918 RepID=UPI0006987E05|nr:ATP-binding cassette domain-containing protein [Nitriliruptor alkaliphilus]